MKKNANKSSSFSDFEREAIQDRARELLAETKAAKNKAAGEKICLDRIATMTGSDQVMAKRIHQLFKQHAPSLWPKTWYSMPAYATKVGKVVAFFQDAKKFKARYATLGFTDAANLDDGNVWATSFGLKKLTPADEKKIVALIQQAMR